MKEKLPLIILILILKVDKGVCLTFTTNYIGIQKSILVPKKNKN